ncbi:MAG: Nif3-like dinuclear metal center hexameric protein, partial [Planctomycetes bacterium]|nr:Nif3-like dinuclear metal center hexameric protein [Planctomycetota bacterium]
MAFTRPVTVRDLCDFLEVVSPPVLGESWDNLGLLLGEDQAAVNRVLTCLTLTPEVAQEAIDIQAQLIVTHHPILFKPIQKLNCA